MCLLPDRARDKLELVGVVGMTVLKRSGPELQTCNHFFGTVKMVRPCNTESSPWSMANLCQEPQLECS